MGQDKWVRRWEVESSNSMHTYTVAVDAMGNWGCSCPVWKFKRLECKHIQKIKASQQEIRAEIISLPAYEGRKIRLEIKKITRRKSLKEAERSLRI